MLNKKVFITGATGFIGYNFVKHLLKYTRQENITCIVRSTSHYNKLADLGVNIIIGDIKNLDGYDQELLESNYVYHFAANSNFLNIGSYVEDNIDSTKHIVNILTKSKNLELFLFASTIGAVDRKRRELRFNTLDESSPTYPRSEYGKSKLECEKIISKTDLPFIILRITWAYGPGMRLNSHISTFIKDSIKNKIYTRINFPGRVSLIYVDDLINGIWFLSNSKEAINNIYFISDSNATTLGEIFKKINSNIGRELKLVSLPRWLVWILKIFTPLLPFKASVLFNDSLVCSSKKIENLGFNPKIDYEKGLIKTVEWIKLGNNDV